MFSRNLQLAFLISCAMAQSSLAVDRTREIDRLNQIVSQQCLDCHDIDNSEAGVQLTASSDHEGILAKRAVWSRALDQVRSGTMPPDDVEMLEKDRRELVRMLESLLHDVDWKRVARPGRFAMTRKTTAEYRHSVRDLFGVDLQAGLYLPSDPEGQTGFTNDRANLSISLNAMDAYFKEAERVVDAVLGYGHPRWKQTIQAEDAWQNSSDRSVGLSDDQQGVSIKERNAPFSLMIDPPNAGLYRVRVTAKTFGGEPASGMTLFHDGRFIKGFTVRGTEHAVYETRVNLPATSSTITLAFDDGYAAIIQPKFKPRVVPRHWEDEIIARPYRTFQAPANYPSTKDAERALEKLNNVVREMSLTADLAQWLIDQDRVDFEQHAMPDKVLTSPGTSRSARAFLTSKVPLNLSAGKVAQLAGIPQRQLEKQIDREVGFEFNRYRKVVNAYLDEFQKKYPERARKKPGRLIIDAVSLESHALHVNESGPDWIFDGSPGVDTASEVLKKLARRAYGRPATESELNSLIHVYEVGSAAEKNAADADPSQTHLAGLRDAMVGLLVSPRFLLRFSQGESLAGLPPLPGSGGIDDFELASRLSHFLWLSIPDDRLLALAQNGRLRDAEVLKAEATRMIADRRFDDACRTFVWQWLNIESLATNNSLSPLLADAMKQEPFLFVRRLFREDHSLLGLIDGDDTFANAVLANHYDLDFVTDSPVDVQSVSLRQHQGRGGLLGMGAVLASTSTPQRTSPVVRGAWVVEILLGEDLPLPPPSVPELKTNIPGLTVRAQLERHRDDRQCASCHDRIDPFGFVLESFDRTGAWRDRENGGRIQTNTVLADGTVLDGVDDLRDYLKGERRTDIVRNIVVRMFEFALGREVRYHDEQMIRKTVDDLASEGFKAQSLIHSIIQSNAFVAGPNEETHP